MGDRWIVTRDGKQCHGPFSDAQLKDLASSSRLLPSDMLWQEGSTQWVPADSIDGLFSRERVVAELPEFFYAHLPFFRKDHRRVAFTVERSGILTAVSKTDRMYVSGSGGGGSVYTDFSGHVQGSSASFSIRTTHETTMDLWIRDDDGRESSIRIKKDIPLKAGHRVSVVNACLDGLDTFPCMILNHTAKEMHFLNISRAIRLSPFEWLAITFLAVADLLFIGMLLTLFDRELWTLAPISGAIVGGLVILFIHLLGCAMRERFTRHCENVAGLLLSSCRTR